MKVERESVKHDDDSDQECFRKYNNHQNHLKITPYLTGRPRYSKLFDFSKGDYKVWAKGLRTAGYATDPRYPDKLISYIERYKLNQYDKQVLDDNMEMKRNGRRIKLNQEIVATDLLSYVVQKRR
jgi:flagellum-specific peptidoglycan hydrolase FlgJ